MYLYTCGGGDINDIVGMERLYLTVWQILREKEEYLLMFI